MSHYPDPNFNANCRLTIKNLPQDKDPVIIQKLLLELFTQVGPVFKISLNTLRVLVQRPLKFQVLGVRIKNLPLLVKRTAITLLLTAVLLILFMKIHPVMRPKL